MHGGWGGQILKLSFLLFYLYFYYFYFYFFYFLFSSLLAFVESTYIHAYLLLVHTYLHTYLLDYRGTQAQPRSNFTKTADDTLGM